jgi:hypothetical protein
MRQRDVTGRSFSGIAHASALLACTRATESAEPLLPPPVLSPPCDSPAPLLGTWNPGAPRYFVIFHDTVDVRAEVDRLAARYGFQPRHVYEHVLGGFSAALTPEAVAGLRCEPNVSYVEHVGVAFLLA